MKSKQENKYSMFLSTEQVCNDNNSVWAGLPAFVTAFAAFQACIADINTTRLAQEADLKGIAQDKQIKEDEMIRQALAIAKPIIAFANVTGNSQLKQEVDYSESELRKSRDTILENKCQIIHDRANTNIGSLAPYGVTAGMVTAYQTAINDYHSLIAGPRSAIAMRKTQTTQLDEKLNAGTLILTGQLDQLVVLFKVSNPTFVSDYTNARIIVDLGAGANTFTGTVAGGETKNIINNANDDAEEFEITNTGNDPLKFGRGVNSNDMGNSITFLAGETITKTALELGASGNKFLNVQNENAAEGSYKVVRQ